MAHTTIACISSFPMPYVGGDKREWLNQARSGP